MNTKSKYLKKTRGGMNLLTKEQCAIALCDMYNRIYGEKYTYEKEFDVLSEVIEEYFLKETPAKPLNESRQDKLCPMCGAYLVYDALNQPVEEAPNYCSNCGQKLDWSELNGN